MASTGAKEALRRSERMPDKPAGSTAHDCPYFSSLLDESWPWATDLCEAFARLRAAIP